MRRQPALSLGAVLALAFALTACSDPPVASEPARAAEADGAERPVGADTAAAFPRLAKVEGGRVEQLDLNVLAGRLVREGRCLRLIPDSTSFVALPPGAGSAFVVWPTGAVLDGDTIRAPQRGVAVTIGGPAALDGFNRGWHSYAGASALGLTEPIPASCSGPHWVAGTILGEAVPPPPLRPPPPPPLSE